MITENELARKQTEAEAIRKDIKAARDIINRALIQYTKKKIGARNRQQTKEQESFLEERFKDLELYETTRDIQDAYGYGIFDMEEYDRLMDLWELREEAKKNAGKYRDRVTDMLEVAIRRCGDEYLDILTEADDMQHEYDKQKREAERLKKQHAWEKKRAEI